MKFPDNYIPLAENIKSNVIRAEQLMKIFESHEIEGAVNNLAEKEPDVAMALAAVHTASVEGIALDEAIVKHVDSHGQITRRKDLKTRQRNATATTGLSKAKRREIARRAVKTKRSNPSIQTRADRKRKKALKKRKSLGL